MSAPVGYTTPAAAASPLFTAMPPHGGRGFVPQASRRRGGAAVRIPSATLINASDRTTSGRDAEARVTADLPSRAPLAPLPPAPVNTRMRTALALAATSKSTLPPLA